MSWRRNRAEEDEKKLRSYRVSEPRMHERGYTVYRVTSRIISKKTPQDVKEVVVFKRYSDFKKLHSELSYIHRNLFRRAEEFPAFPRAQVFGRFDESVIEERRRCAEEILSFTVQIPALNNSPQLKDFFRDGEVTRPLDLAASQDAVTLPAPLIPLPLDGGEATRQGGLPLGQTHSEPEPQSPERECDFQLDLGLTTETSAPTAHLPDELIAGFQPPGLASLSNSGTEEEEDEPRPTRSPLSDNELAQFDPCARAGEGGLSLPSEVAGDGEEGGRSTEDMEDRLRRLRTCAERPADAGARAGEAESEEAYLSTAAEQIKQALGWESSEDYAKAFRCYRNGVDTLLKGVQGDSNPERREAVKKKTADYMKHAEAIFDLHLRDSPHNDFGHS